MQKLLFDDDYKEKTTSERVRDESFINNQESFLTKREIIKRIISAHPEGISDQEISEFTGFPLSCVNGRRNELRNIQVVGISTYEDENGNTYSRCLWGYP